ncbi:MAG: sirohydrochlorin cobaltochelatase [Sedimentibacter sp.]
MKKAIVVTSFGCSIKDSRKKYIETIENSIKNNYKDIDCFRVFTSEIIRKKIKKEENIEVDNMKICFEKLKENGYTHVYIAVTYIIPGIEYEIILKTTEKYKNDFEEIKIARTFLDDNMGKKEINVIKSYIKTDLNNDEAVVLVGHGTNHESHKYYKTFEELLRKEVNSTYIVSIEKTPMIEDIMSDLKEKEIKKIYLYPFLIVAGNHALNDITSDDDDSIKSHLIKSNFKVNSFNTGLGNNEGAMNLFNERLKECIKTNHNFSS